MSQETEQAVAALKRAFLKEIGEMYPNEEDVTVVVLHQSAHLGMIKLNNDAVKYTSVDVDETVEYLMQTESVR